MVWVVNLPETSPYIMATSGKWGVSPIWSFFFSFRVVSHFYDYGREGKVSCINCANRSNRQTCIKVAFTISKRNYCWWLKSCTSWGWQFIPLLTVSIHSKVVSRMSSTNSKTVSGFKQSQTIWVEFGRYWNHQIELNDGKQIMNACILYVITNYINNKYI